MVGNAKCGAKIKRSDGAYADVRLCRNHGEDLVARQAEVKMLNENPEGAQRIYEHVPTDGYSGLIYRQLVQLEAEAKELGE